MEKKKNTETSSIRTWISQLDEALMSLGLPLSKYDTESVGKMVAGVLTKDSPCYQHYLKTKEELLKNPKDEQKNINIVVFMTKMEKTTIENAKRQIRIYK